MVYLYFPIGMPDFGKQVTYVLYDSFDRLCGGRRILQSGGISIILIELNL